MGWLSKKDPEQKRAEKVKKIRRTNGGGGDKYGFRELRRGEERAALYRRNDR